MSDEKNFQFDPFKFGGLVTQVEHLQQKVMINHLADLDKKLGSMQFNMEQLQVGREAFIKMLSESLTAPAEVVQ